jgi:hypothetical protein
MALHQMASQLWYHTGVSLLLPQPVFCIPSVYRNLQHSCTKVFNALAAQCRTCNVTVITYAPHIHDASA